MRNNSRLAARFESDWAFVAHHENLASSAAASMRLDSCKVSHEWLRDVHAHDCDVGREIPRANAWSERNHNVAHSAKSLAKSNEPASDRPLVGKVGTRYGDTVGEDIRRGGEILCVD